VVEPMGAETKLYLQTGAHTFTCLTQSAVARSEAGRRLRCTINPEKTHFFDPASTRRINSA
jgi:ABC-type sugar transport system ATPase subunit